MDKFDTSSPRRAQVDAKAVRRQVRSILHSLDRMRSSEAYWQVGAVANEVRQLLEQGWTLIQVDDGRNALALLEAITEAYVADWTNLDDSDGEASGFFQDLGPIWTEALLSVDLASRERKVWASKLENLARGCMTGANVTKACKSQRKVFFSRDQRFHSRSGSGTNRRRWAKKREPLQPPKWLFARN